MSKWKNKTKFTDFNDMEISNLPDKKSKIMVINMFTKLK